MQLEAAHAVEITKLIEYVDRKEGRLIEVVRTHQHNTDSAEMPQGRITERNNNKGELSEENYRNMAWEEDAWTIAT